MILGVSFDSVADWVVVGSAVLLALIGGILLTVLLRGAP
jgi:hypothetical protein